MKTRAMSLMVIFMLGVFAVFAGDKTKSVKVKGVNDSCKERIEKAVKAVDGVSAADWNIETKMLAVTFDDAKTDIDKIELAIAAVGHDTPNHKASDEVYNTLPDDCKYRELDEEEDMQ